MQDNITGWFTTDEGNHIPIRNGQSKVQAMKDFASSHNSESIESQRKRVANLGMSAGPAGSESWNKWFSESQKLANREKQLKEEYKKKHYSKPSTSVYVNSYGEATHRNITSGTYERSQKRQQRDVDNWFRR